MRGYIVRPVVSAKRYMEWVSASHVTASALLRQARQAASVPQREVAARVGVQQSVVSAYEDGGREPSLATLSSPVEACGVTLEVHLTAATSCRPEAARARSDQSDAGLPGAAPRCWRRPLVTG